MKRFICFAMALCFILGSLACGGFFDDSESTGFGDNQTEAASEKGKYEWYSGKDEDVLNGNSGIYAYRHTEKIGHGKRAEYTLIINFDEGYCYYINDREVYQ